MTRLAINARNLGKQFLIGAGDRGQTFREALIDVVSRPFRRSGPKRTDEEFWALRDLDFDIHQGDVVGIVGRNGAGKSTLLKVLSRITEPTTGEVRIRGRVSSLLEVGTGFHPELTGRENIYVNGAILGMRRKEIDRKFDEIVAFAEVARFLDTPVKRYSSGMYVRLAFSVAAHLDSDVLIVDEVLAVGDAEFQKKCLGKMGEVAKTGGRTVLFVSHQLGQVSRLCSTGMLLDGGRLVVKKDVGSVLSAYVDQIQKGRHGTARPQSNTGPLIATAETTRSNGQPMSDFMFDEPISLRCTITGMAGKSSVVLSVTLVSRNGDYVTSIFVDVKDQASLARIGCEVRVTLPPRIFAPRDYTFRLALFDHTATVFDLLEYACPVRIVDNGSSHSKYESFDYGHVIVPAAVTIGDVI